MWKLRQHNTEKEKAYLEMGKGRLMARLLSQRECITPDNLDEFTNASYSSLSHPHSLKGTEEAARIFCKTVSEGKSIGIVGDYDVDGIASATMLSELCYSLSGNVFGVFLPSRFRHGYGLSSKAIEDFLTTPKGVPDLLIIADCGANNEPEIQAIRKLGVKNIIIIDHHIVSGKTASKSADALINWRLCDKEEMCAAGQVYQFIRAVRCLTGKVDPIEYLAYAAIATIADSVPVIGDNRIIVKNGLTESTLSRVTSCGLGSLLESNRIDYHNLTQKDVAFRVAPRLNAAGRMYEPDIAHGLLTEKNPDDAMKVAKLLEGYNDERKKLQKQAENDAFDTLSIDKKRYQHAIALLNPDWHLGVLGIVASKIVDAFGLPTIIGTVTKEGMVRASIRSIPEVDLVPVLEDCKNVSEECGGHSAAGGLTVPQENFEEFARAFSEACGKHKASATQHARLYDAALKPETICVDTAVELVNTLYPYCQQNNPEPIFLTPRGKLRQMSLASGKGWDRLSFRIEGSNGNLSSQFVTFRPKVGTDYEGELVDVYFSLPQGGNFQPTVEDIIT